MRKPRGIAARFWAGEDPDEMAKERCFVRHGGSPYSSPCLSCSLAIWSAIRRDYTKKMGLKARAGRDTIRSSRRNARNGKKG